MLNHTLLIRKDGTRLPVADAAAPIINSKGEILGSVVVFRDVSKEREIDKAKTEFVSLASHELRGPIAAMNWNSEMLMSNDFDKLTPKQREYIKVTYQSGQRMSELVNALLNVSRLELGTFVIEPKKADIFEIAKICIKEIEPQLLLKKLHFKTKFDKEIPEIMADPKLLGIVFRNLLTNAVKYTPIGGKIEFVIEQENDGIMIKLIDTGIGIPKNQQDKIFTKLFRADNVKIVDPNGTGLGLYIVKEILDHSGGKIWFESKLGKGTTFYVSLPLSGMTKKEGTRKLI
jgi:signal transduction histidine kinase